LDVKPFIETFKPFKFNYIFWYESHGKEVANAIFDIALHIFKASGGLPEDRQQLADQACVVLDGAEYMVTVSYFIKGLDWAKVFEVE